MSCTGQKHRGRAQLLVLDAKGSRAQLLLLLTPLSVPILSVCYLSFRGAGFGAPAAPATKTSTAKKNLPVWEVDRDQCPCSSRRKYAVRHQCALYFLQGACRCALLFAVASGLLLHRLPILRSGNEQYEACVCVALGNMVSLRCSGTRSGK